MAPARLLRELAYPLVTPAVVLSLIALFVAAQIGWSLVSVFLLTIPPFGWILLILLLIFLLPVTSRYLVVLAAGADVRDRLDRRSGRSAFRDCAGVDRQCGTVAAVAGFAIGVGHDQLRL